MKSNLVNITFIICSIFLFSSAVSFSQTDTLNRTNASGERYGWWIVYLDNNLEEVKDSADATHCHYTMYKGKFNYYNMGPIGTKKRPLFFQETIRWK